MPSIPKPGRKALLPRYHPQFAGNPAQLKSANTLLTCNAVTRPILLSVQRAAPGRKPGIARKRLPPSRSRFCRKPIQGSPISAVAYRRNSNISPEKMQEENWKNPGKFVCFLSNGDIFLTNRVQRGMVLIS